MKSSCHAVADYGIPVTSPVAAQEPTGSACAPYGGISLDLGRLDQIVEIDEESLVVTVGAGIDGPTLEEKLNEKGLTLAHYPGSYHLGATIGGFVAARGSGVVSTKYGKAEDQVVSSKS